MMLYHRAAVRNTSSIAQPQASRRTSNKAPQVTFMSHSGAEMHRQVTSLYVQIILIV